MTSARPSCLCGCGGFPKSAGSRFLPGHDSRYYAVHGGMPHQKTSEGRTATTPRPKPTRTIPTYNWPTDVDTWVSLLHGDVMDQLAKLPDSSVQMVVTSPPYYGLRDYGEPGQLGLEDTPQEYIAKMVLIFREIRRVLRDDGTLWLNIGDSYAGSGKGQNGDGSAWSVGHPESKQSTNVGTLSGGLPTGTPPGIKTLDMMGIPWTLALALRDDGWYLRSEIVWHKTNPMPESVFGWRWEQHRRKVKAAVEDWRVEGRERSGLVETAVNHTSGGNTGLAGEQTVWENCTGCKMCAQNGGLVLRRGSWRPTKAHEQLFLLTKSGRYFCDTDAIRERTGNELSWENYGGQAWHDHGADMEAGQSQHKTMQQGSHPAGRNKRSVWTFPIQPRPDAHFSTFPDALVEPCIMVGTSEGGCCPACGAPYVRHTEITPEYATLLGQSWHDPAVGDDTIQYGRRRSEREATHTPPDERSHTLGWLPSCRCAAGDPQPCIVLDPFIGSGTTAAVARRLLRRTIGIDLKSDYLQIAARRIARVDPNFQIDPVFGDGELDMSLPVALSVPNEFELDEDDILDTDALGVVK